MQKRTARRAVAVGMLALAFVSHGPKAQPAPDANAPAFDKAKLAEVSRIFEQRCIVCHAKKPTFEGILEAPKGFILEDPKRWTEQSQLIHQQVVATNIMPLGNLTQMTPEERATIAAWVAAGAPAPE